MQAGELHGHVRQGGDHGRHRSADVLAVQGPAEVYQEPHDRAVPQIPGDTSEAILRDPVEQQADQRGRVSDRRARTQPAVLRFRRPQRTGLLLVVRDFEPYGIHRWRSLCGRVQASGLQRVERIQR